MRKLVQIPCSLTLSRCVTRAGGTRAYAVTGHGIESMAMTEATQPTSPVDVVRYDSLPLDTYVTQSHCGSPWMLPETLVVDRGSEFYRPLRDGLLFTPTGIRGGALS